MRVHQWVADWNRVKFSSADHRRKPEPYFYIFSISAVELRSLCGISRRQASRVVARSEDLGIQRQHDKERSEEIGRFVEFGYPWSTLTEAKRNLNQFNGLRKPGWLPTAIVVNIIGKDDLRQGKAVDPTELVTIEENGDGGLFIKLPYTEWRSGWRPSQSRHLR